MARVINASEERALFMEHAVKMGNSYGVPADTARELFSHETVERLMDRHFAGLYWNVHEDTRGTVTYLTMLGFKTAAQNYKIGRFMEGIINASEERALFMEHAVKMGNSYGVPADMARKLFGHEAVERLMDRHFAGLYWNVHEDARGTVTYLTMLGFKRAAQNSIWAGKFDINKYRQRAASSGDLQTDIQTGAAVGG